MTAKDPAAALRMILRGEAGTEDTFWDDLEMTAPECVNSFAEAGVMTSDEGLVVTMDDGSEFQITVVESRGRSRPVDPEDCCQECGREVGAASLVEGWVCVDCGSERHAAELREHDDEDDEQDDEQDDDEDEQVAAIERGESLHPYDAE